MYNYWFPCFAPPCVFRTDLCTTFYTNGRATAKSRTSTLSRIGSGRGRGGSGPGVCSGVSPQQLLQQRPLLQHHGVQLAHSPLQLCHAQAQGPAVLETRTRRHDVIPRLLSTHCDGGQGAEGACKGGAARWARRRDTQAAEGARYIRLLACGKAHKRADRK